MKALNRIIEQSKSATKKQIVLPEGIESRVINAAIRIKAENIANPILLGDSKKIQSIANNLNVDLRGIDIIDPATSEKSEELSKLLFKLRSKKGMTIEQAKELVLNPLWFGNLMVKAGHADGCVSGSITSTSDVVRTALQVIGVKKDCNIVSSFFIMMLDKAHHPVKGGMIFTDCALVVEPNAVQLSEIAMAAAKGAEQFLQAEPRVAMLSFSSSGSAQHPAVDKVCEATALVKKAMPNLLIDGEVQFDAAIIPAISERKVKDSQLNGTANVLVFPSLEAGNIGYKIAERIGGAQAMGPILQGLAKPANDLSRGCSVDDICNTVALTVIQANQES